MNGFTVAPSSVVGGSSSTGTISLHGQAGPSGVVATLTSNTSSATVPASVSIPSGSSTGAFTIATGVVNSTTTAILAATYGVTVHNSLTITAGGLSNLSLSLNSVYGGNSTTGTVTLSAPAPIGGTSVNLSSNSASALVPATVVVPSGALSAQFTVATIGVDSLVSATITATLGVTSKTAVLSITPATLAGFTIAPASVTGGATATGTISLHGQAGPSGISVSVASNIAAASAPATVAFPAGSTSGTFTINTGVVNSTTTAIFAVTYGVTVHNSLTITAGGLSNFTLSLNSVYGGNSSVGTVTLSAPAPGGGTVVSLSSNNSNATVPATVTVSAGSNSAMFTVTTVGVDAVATSTITASLGGISINRSLAINPAALAGFGIAPSSVVGGYAASGTISLQGQAGPSGIGVVITSNSTAAIVPATVTIPAGSTGMSFNINTSVVSANINAVLAATYGVTVHNSLTITSGGLSTFSLSVNNVHGGVSSTGTVTLSALAPAGGVVVNLASNNSNATVPATVTVLAGSDTASFTVNTVGVDSVVNATITATLGATSIDRSLTINPAALIGFSIAPINVTGGSSATGTILLQGQVGPSGVSVTVSSNTAAATVPATVVIPAGATSGTFAIDTGVVASTTNAVIAVTLGVTTHGSLTINPGGLFSFADTKTSHFRDLTSFRDGIIAKLCPATAGVSSGTSQRLRRPLRSA